MDYPEEKMIKVHYYAWSFNRYGDKDYDYVVDWIPESRLVDLEKDRSISDLKVLES